MLFPLPLLHRVGPQTALTKVLFFPLRMGASRMGTLPSSTAVGGGTHPSPAEVPRTPGPCPWPLPGQPRCCCLGSRGAAAAPQRGEPGPGQHSGAGPCLCHRPCSAVAGAPCLLGLPRAGEGHSPTASPEVRRQCYPGCPCSPPLLSRTLSGPV